MTLFEAQTDKLMDQLEHLSGRERVLAGVGGLAAFMLFGFLISMFLSSSLRGRESNNRDLEIKLGRILQKQGEYVSARQKVKELERRIRSKGVRSLVPYLDRASRKFQLRIHSMNPVVLGKNGKKRSRIKETSVRIELNKADLASVARFFQNVERSGRVVKVRRLRMRPNFSDPKRVNVVAIVSSYILTK